MNDKVNKILNLLDAPDLPSADLSAFVEGRVALRKIVFALLELREQAMLSAVTSKDHVSCIRQLWKANADYEEALGRIGGATGA